jgi:putative hydrolase of HD superfamily
MTYPSLKRFTTLLHRFHGVERVAHVPTLTRRTNGPEHTFQLAMTAWYLTSSMKLPLSHEKVMKYALAHDLVEAHAGDTFLYDEEARATKDAREKEALDRIAHEHPEFPELIEVITHYEHRDDLESRFVYALDKMIDPLNASMDPMRAWWKELRVPYSMFRSAKDHKIALSPDIDRLWRELVAELESQKDFYFPQEK